MITFISAAVVLGLSAGFSPGPLLTLVITQTLQHGVKEGIKVSVAPLITDIPIICLAILLLSLFSRTYSILGWLSMAGGLFVMYLAWKTFRADKPDVSMSGKRPRSLGMGLAVNAMSPHPYIFWMTVGAPIVIRAKEESLIAAGSFILTFLLCLVGSKVLAAALTGRTRRALTGRGYRYTMRALGLFLFVFAMFLIKDGLALIGVGVEFP